MKGQSLMEMVIALGIVLAVISTIAIITLNGMQNSQFSKNQVQATKLAQDGIDKVRTIKSRNYTVCGIGSNLWTDLYAHTCATSGICNFQIRSTSACGGSDPVSLNSIGTPESITLDGITFQRAVNITEAGSLTQKQVTVTVSWTDISGSHSSKLVTVLAQY